MRRRCSKRAQSYVVQQKANMVLSRAQRLENNRSRKHRDCSSRYSRGSLVSLFRLVDGVECLTFAQGSRDARGCLLPA